MRKLKNFISGLFLVFFTILFVAYFSIKGEEDYSQSCENLGVACERGRVQKMEEKFSAWIEQIKKDFNL